jgi:hypothetical protein
MKRLRIVCCSGSGSGVAIAHHDLALSHTKNYDWS